MKKLYAICLFILIGVASNAQAPNWLWAKSAGGSGDDRALSTATDAQGNIYVTGFFSSPTIAFGSITLTNPGMFIVKYDASGNVLWAKDAIGGFSQANSVASDVQGNVYVAGYFSVFTPTLTFDSITLTHHGMFLVKYDSSGNVIWAKDVVKAGSVANSIAVDNLGNIFVGGSFGSDSLFIGPDTLLSINYNGFFAKYDSAGNPLWARGFYAGGVTADVNAPFIAADKYGNLYVTGGFHPNNCIIVTTVLVNQGDYNIYLAKFDDAGNLLWAKRYGASGEDKATSIATDTSDNIFITGYFTSTNIIFDSFTLPGVGYTAFVVKLDASGTALWAKKFGRLDYPAPTKIVADKNEDVFVTGYFTSPALVFTPTDSLVNEGLFLAKYDSSGNFKWARDAIGDVSRATGIGVDAFGSPIIAGYFVTDSIVFDSTVLFQFAGSDFDIYIATIDNLVSIEEFYARDDGALLVFPNPSNGKFFVQTKQLKSSRILIYDGVGKEIFNKISGDTIEPIDISTFPKGIYFVRVLTDNLSYSKKIIIQ